jgi:hypothetical protein
MLTTFRGQNDAVWFFQVEDASHPKLSPLLLEGVNSDALIYSSFGDDTAMLLSSDAFRRYIDTIDIVSAVENLGNPPQITRWHLPVRYRSHYIADQP